MSESLIMVFGGATVVLLAVAYALQRRHAEQAAPEDEEDAAAQLNKGGWFRALGAAVRPKEEEDLEVLRNRLARAGLNGREVVDRFVAGRLVLGVTCFSLGIFFACNATEPASGIVFLLVMAALATLGPGMWLGIRSRERQRMVSLSLPPTLDLIVTCLDAGLQLEQALARVSDESRAGDDILAAEIRTTLAELRAGLPVELVFRRLALRVDLEDLSTLAALVAQAAALGTNISNVLRGHAAAIRHHRMLRLEEQAGKANAKLTLPLTLCLLPSILTLLLGPAVVMMVRSL